MSEPTFRWCSDCGACQCSRDSEGDRGDCRRHAPAPGDVDVETTDALVIQRIHIGVAETTERPYGVSP